MKACHYLFWILCVWLMVAAGISTQAKDVAKLHAEMIKHGLITQVNDLKKIEKQIKQSEARDVIALTRAADYDIFQSDVLVQTVYSQKLEETILFLPVIDASKKRPAKIPNWEIRVIFPKIEDSEHHPIIKTKNIRKLKPWEFEKKKLGKAVIFAWWYLTKGKSVLSPLVIKAGKDKSGIFSYYLATTDIPATPGADSLVNLSEDLKSYSIVPGL